MRLLKMKLNELLLFEGGIELDFVAQQRVTELNDEGLTHIKGNVYRQNVLGIIGINASGKTTVLKILSFIFDLYLKQGKLNGEQYSFLANEQSFTIEAYFHFNDNQLMKIESIVTRNPYNQLVFQEEKIWKKTINKVKKSLYSFTDKDLQAIRTEENSPYLADDMSMIIAYMKNQQPLDIIDLISETNKNVMKKQVESHCRWLVFLIKVLIIYMKKKIAIII